MRNPSARRTSRATLRILAAALAAITGGVGAAQGQLDTLALEPVATGLGIPVALNHAGSERLYLSHLGGQVLILEQGELSTTPFLDIGDRILGAGFGLWSIAFHPDFDDNGFVFAHYAESGAGDSVISRFRVTGDPDHLDPATEVVLLRIPKRQPLHYGGFLQFGPDGYLYLSTGDSTASGIGPDPGCVAQSLDSLEGKILRLDVDRNADRPPYYAVPADNPFAEPARAEVWAYGLRNPWRFSFDRETGELWISDVGSSRREEVNLQPAGDRGGRNYGWKVMEGSRCFGNLEGCDGSLPACNDSGLTLPAIEYTHADGHCAIIGGHAYRGRLVPGLYGAYVYGDLCSGAVWAAVFDGGARVSRRLPVSLSGLTSFGEDAGGELWLMDQGNLYRLVDSALPAQGLLEFDATALAVGEGDGIAPVAVRRLGGTTGAVSVTVHSEAETATSGTDYRAPDTVLRWGDGDGAVKTFPLEILDDGSDEPEETLLLELRSPEGGAVLGARSRAGVSILDDEGCVVDQGTLCLGGGRFRVRVAWQDFAGNPGFARTVPFGSDDAGLFWFFDPQNWEMLVKVLDGCSFNDHFWVFSAATTNVEYTLTVTDTLTAESRSYRNELGASAPAITDTEAFAACDN